MLWQKIKILSYNIKVYSIKDRPRLSVGADIMVFITVYYNLKVYYP